MQATEMKHVGGDAPPPDTESSNDASSHPSYESEDQVKADVELLGKMYSLTGAGS